MKRIGAALALAASLVGTAQAAPRDSPWGRSYFPNPEPTTQDGQKVKFHDDLIEDKLVVVTFIYTHCNKQCPLITSSLARVQRHLAERMGKDVFFYSISLSGAASAPPATTTPATRSAHR